MSAETRSSTQSSGEDWEAALEEAGKGRLCQYSISQRNQKSPGMKGAEAQDSGQHAHPTVRSASKQRLGEDTVGQEAQPVAVKKRYRESRRTDGTLSSITQELMESVLTMTRSQVRNKLRLLGCPTRGSTTKLKAMLRAELLENQISSEDEEAAMGA